MFDLRQTILERPDLFELVRYEQSIQSFRLQARGEKKDDAWDDWDELLKSFWILNLKTW